MKLKKGIDIHLELDGKDVEIYVDGWFLGCVAYEDMSKEARESVFKQKGE